ncbi:MAG: 4-(cytidine 5'-diphospho)-2-C-methyl-D-erythritol kinase [Clostridia bacterium]|nr:4-(cytidine 5'-diphospho)-2-C-methyl-D-erythritol kinase [Clostridia bacterium]
MDSLTVKSFAKINLSLDVLGTLENGYHEVKMVMQTVSLYDIVELTKQEDGISLSCSLKFLPTGRENLAYRAAEAFFAETGIEGGVKIFLKKHIPVGAGLAGGSSNAAAVLTGLNRLYEAGLSTRRLCEIGTALGADVPYCIIGGTRLAEGIGEKLSPLPPLPACHIVLVKPSFSISTKWVYDNIDACPDIVHPPTDNLIEALKEGDLYKMCENMGNVLEDVSIAHYPVLTRVKEDLVALGAIASQMSGSGPTVFGIFDDEEKARNAKEVLWKKYKTAYVCRGVNSFNRRR